MISEYLQMLNACPTPNRVNALNIYCERSMTPSEAIELVNGISLARSLAVSPETPDPTAIAARSVIASTMAALPEKHAEFVDRWIEKLAQFMVLSTGATSEPYARQRIGRQVSIYSAGGDTARKRLLICFTGAGQRMMMPVPVFLQNLPADDYDVVLLHDETRSGFRGGIPGVGDSLAQMVDTIGGARRRLYDSVISLGVSGGGLPSIWMSLQLGLDKGIAVGPNHPDDARWDVAEGPGLREIFATYAARLPRPPNLLVVYGADEQRDREAALALAQFIPVRTLAVAGPEGARSGHNALFTLLLKGTLAPFLDLATAQVPDWDELQSIASDAAPAPVSAPSQP